MRDNMSNENVYYAEDGTRFQVLLTVIIIIIN